MLASKSELAHKPCSLCTRHNAAQVELHFKRTYGDDSFVINEDKTIIIRVDCDKYRGFNASLETLALIENFGNIVELDLPNCRNVSGHRVSSVGPVRKERVGVGSWHGGGVGLSCTCV